MEDSALTGLLRHSLGGATVVDVGADLGRAHRLLPDATAGVLVTDGRVRIPPLSGHWLVLDATSESAGAVDGVVHAPVRLWPWTSADPVRRRRRTRSRDALDLGARVEAYLRRLQAAGPDGEREAA